MQFRGLDQSLQLIAEPRGDPLHEKELFKDADVFSRRLVVHPDLSADLSEVGKLPGLVGKYLEQARQLIQLLYFRDIPHIPLYDRLHIVASPSLTSPKVFSSQHLRVAAY
jgi:hypothetical protein